MRGGINIKNEEEARNILEIPDDVTKSDLKNKATLQYKKLSLTYHPDRHMGSSADIQKIMSDKFDKISSAYSFIVKDESGESGSEEKEEEKKITDYYSMVTNNVFLTTFANWSDDELINFKKNMEHILRNPDFKYFSTYDLLVEFSAFNPFDYIDLLTENLEYIKKFTLSEISELTKNYENEKMEDYKLYFKTDYEMFNNLYVEKEPIKFIEDVKDVSGSSTPNGEDTVSPTERERSATVSGPGDVSISSTPNVSGSPTERVISDKEDEEAKRKADDDFTAKMYEDNAWGGADIKGSNTDEYSSDYVNLIYGDFPNEIELNALFNKIKNAKKNPDELNKLLGDVPPEAVQIIKDNSKKIEQLTTDIQPTLNSLISKFQLLIENENKESNMITQDGGNIITAALASIVIFQGFLSILKEIKIDISELIPQILSKILPSAISNFLITIVDFTLLLPQTIGSLIRNVTIENLKGTISTLLDITKMIDFFKSLFTYLPGSVYNLFSMFTNALYAMSNWKRFILFVVAAYGAKKGYEWYYYNSSIAALDKKSWFRSLTLKTRDCLRRISKACSFYQSSPDDLAAFNIAEKNNWVRKSNNLRMKLYRENAFFEFDYDEFVRISKPLVSTVTVMMPQLNDEIYRKIADTNLHTVEQVYNQDKLFIDRQFNGYPNRESLVILSCYDTYQYYAFNQFKNILKELENSKYIDYINNYIPWYLNKKNLLDTKLIGNLSFDTSYPLLSFKDSTKAIVYFDFVQQKYVLNVDQAKIDAFKINEPIGDVGEGGYRIYKPVRDINFSCKKFEKILNYLILMKTGYMVDIRNDTWTYIPQPHLLPNPVDDNNITNINENPELFNTVHRITPATTQYFLPFVYSISDELGLNLFAYFLEKRGYKYKVLHELSANESAEKRETIKRSYPIINVEGNEELKTMQFNFFLQNIVHTLDNKEFEERFGQELRAEPICVLLHPFKTEGIDAKYNPAIFLLEPALNFGDYEQLCGRVLRTYDGRATYNEKPKKMIYQCLTSSRVALNKFGDNYSHLKKDVDILEEDYFSIKNFFDLKDIPIVADPYTGFELKNSYLSYYCPNLVNYIYSNLASKNILTRGAVYATTAAVIGSVTPIGALASAGIAAIATIGSSVISGVTANVRIQEENDPQALGKTITIKDALLPNTILNYAIYSSLENTIYTDKTKVVTEGNNFPSNVLKVFKTQLNSLDREMEDLVEGIPTENNQDITNSLKKSNFDFYSLLDEFIIKARDALGIHDGSTFKWLRIQLESAFGNERDYFEKTIRGDFAINEKFGVFMELDYKVNKFEYSKYILKDIMKYMGSFIIAAEGIEHEYNISILLELIKYLKIIPSVHDFDINNVDIGSEIVDFLSIKRTEFMFNKILTKRFESKAARPDKTIPDDKIIPDLEAIIESVNSIQDQNIRDKLKFMPWCNTVSTDKYNRCITTNNYFRDVNLNTYNLDNLDEVRAISDRIIAGIDGDVAADKIALDNYYRRMYRPYPALPFVPNAPGDNIQDDNIPDDNVPDDNEPGDNAQGANAQGANAVVANPNAQGANVDAENVILDDIDGGAINKMMTKSKKRTIRKKLSNKVNVSKTRNNRKK
jgi:hypothetical protein